MTRGKRTMWKERINIVQVTLVNNKNYQQTAETYQVSYQQVYKGVRKYEAGMH